MRDVLYQTRLVVNRTPHLSKATRKEANRALDILEEQLGRNQVDAGQGARGIELLNRCHSTLLFALLRDVEFCERFSTALRRLGIRGITEQLDEVPSSVMPLPIPGPIDGRVHRDELPPAERIDAEGRPLPPQQGGI